MRASRVPFVVAAVCSALAFRAPATTGATPATSSSDWRPDARFLVTAIDSLYPRPLRAREHAALDSAAAALERALPVMRPDQAVGGFARLLALLGDGHSRLDQVRLPNHGRPALAPLSVPGFEHFYPLECDVFADGLWIVRATAAHRDLLGARVVAVAGRRPDEALDALAPFISADNPMWRLYVFGAYLRSPGYLAAAGLSSGPDAPLRLTIADARGRTRDVAVAAEPPDSSEHWPAADDGLAAPLPLTRALPYPYAFASLDDSCVFARIRAIVDQPGRGSMAAFVARLFARVDSLGAPRLVIDLRGNGGGDGYLNAPLVHSLLRRPAIDRAGRLFVIVDRGTFSAAAQLAADLERETYAVFVGEPTGAAPDSPGDPAHVTLPASGLVARVSTVQWNGSDPRDPRPFIAPDVPAMPTFADWLAHRDPAIVAIGAYRAPVDAMDAPPNEHWGAKLRAKAPAIAW